MRNRQIVRSLSSLAATQDAEGDVESLRLLTLVATGQGIGGSLGAVDSVGELVSIVGLARDMIGEQRACALDAEEKTLREVGAFEVLVHGGRQFPPERFAALFMHAFVADHGKRV